MDRRRKPEKVKAEAKRPLARKSPKNDGAKVRDLEKRLVESLEREKAAGEILRVISSSSTSVQPTFDAIARAAMSLCEADIGSLFRFDGQLIHVGAFHGTPQEVEASRRAFPQPPSHRSVTARAILAATVVQIDDISADPEASDALRMFRTVLSVPMIREGRPLGAITVARRVVRPFSNEQIALLQTFADQAVIAIENVRLFNETKEALDRQTATAEILRVIASSLTELQPVLDAIARNSALVCDAYDAVVFLREGDGVRDAAHYGPINITLQHTTLSRGSIVEAAILDRQPVHVHDVLATEPPAFPLTAQAARQGGFRTVLSVPLLRESQAIGALSIRRREVQPFTAQQIDLLKTFADQAVIAIENVRLFTETTEALERQTATAEILRVISRSTTDAQPVFDVIVQNACRLCDGVFANAVRFDGALIHNMADYGFSTEAREMLLRAFPAGLTRESMSGRAILARAVVQSEDISAEPATTISYQLSRLAGARAYVSVPLLREGVPIGAITIARPEPGFFPERQVELLQTFADQAVIAIENVRLFTELQASNRELTTALDTQTATSDILRVISGSRTDLQPVFDAIVQSAVRLLQAHSGLMSRVVGDNITLAALTSSDAAGDAAVRASFPLPLHSDTERVQAIREPVNVIDIDHDPRMSETRRAIAQARGYRSLAGVPLLHHAESVGAIFVTRREPGGFTDAEIALLQTFADQAVIAIENARLLTELQARTAELTRSVEQLTALRDVGHAVSSSLELETVLNTIVARAMQLAGATSGTIWEYDPTAEEFVLRITQNVQDPELLERRTARVRCGEGAVGRLALTGAPVQIADITTSGAYEGRLRDGLIAAGTRALLAIPLLHEDRLLGGLVMSRRTPGEFPPEVVELLKTFATQSALAIQNARLFRELEIKSRELEVASQHKSEFLASMSHELRTPLNAVIGFSDVLLDGMFGPTNEKQTEYLHDILASGQHLLSLINDILDLSKIEAGRMELDVAEFELPSAVDDALLLMRERASRRGITLTREVHDGVGAIRADQRKIKQVLLNLLSNAVKFTPEGGRVEVRAACVDGVAEISVSDSGIGIAPEHHEVVFDEFRQVGRADKKAEGTGLGLSLCRKFVELHGGRIWVTSQLGHGSVFTFTVPAQRGDGAPPATVNTRSPLSHSR
jgi:GAF domain-containing protein